MSPPTFRRATATTLAWLLALSGLPFLLASASAAPGTTDPADAPTLCSRTSITGSWPEQSLGTRVYGTVHVPEDASVELIIHGFGKKFGGFHRGIAEIDGTTPQGSGTVLSSPDTPLVWLYGPLSNNSLTIPTGEDERDITVWVETEPSGWLFVDRVDWWLEVRVFDSDEEEHFDCDLVGPDDLADHFGNRNTDGYAGDPVNTGTGNFVDHQVDIAAPEGIYGMELSRTYNAMDFDNVRDPGFGQVGVLGPGWSTPLDTRLRADENGSLVFRDADGRRVRFPRVPSSSPPEWTVPAELFADVTEDSTSRTLQYSGGETWTFDLAGRLLAMDDGRGQSVTIERNSSTGFPVAMESHTPGGDGYTIALTDSNSDYLIDRVTGPDGAMVDYGYTSGRLTSVSRPHYSGDPAGGETFTLDPLTRQITDIHREVDPADDPILRLHNGYDEFGRVIEQERIGGEVASFVYSGLDPETDTRQTTVTLESTGRSQEVTYIHDPHGQLLRIVDPIGAASAWEWDRDQMAGAEDRLHATTAATYDTAGRLEELALPDPFDQFTTSDIASVTYCDATLDDTRPQTTTDPAGTVTEFAYGDPLDTGYPCTPNAVVPSSITQAPGTAVEATTTIESADGLITSLTDPDGVETTFTWDTARRRVLSRTTDDDVTTSGDRTTFYGYDDAGRLRVTRTPMGNETWTTYDGSGLVIQQVGPVHIERAGCVTSCTFPSTPPSGPTTTYTRWLDGTTASRTDPELATWTYERTYPTAEGWTDTEIEPDGDAHVDVYDAAGNIVEERDGDPADLAGDELAVTTHSYDQLNRRESTVSPEGVERHYRYDDAGRLTQTIIGPDPDDPDRTTENIYDLRGRLSQVAGPTGDTDPADNPVQTRTTFSYDAGGRVTSMAEGRGDDLLATAFVYDTLGRLRFRIVDRDGDGAPNDPTSTDPGDRDPDDLVVEYTYTPAGRLASEIHPPQDVTSYDWVTGEQGDKLVTTYGYDDAGQLTTVTPPTGPASETIYDNDGRVASTTTAGGYTATFAYDAAGRITSVTTPAATGGTTEVAVATRSYNQRGDLVAETQPHDPTAIAYPATTYTYFPDGHLETVRDPRQVTIDDLAEISYTYDGRGNRLTRTAWALNDPTDTAHQITQRWSYNLDDQVVRHRRPTDGPTGGTTYIYEPDSGLLSTITRPSGRTETRDYWMSGLLRSQTFSQPGEDDIVVDQWYDTLGRRTRMADDRGNSDYVWDHVGNLTQTTVPGTHQAGYTSAFSWDIEGRRTGVTHDDGAQLRYHHDDLGQLTLSETYVDMIESWWPVAEYDYDADGDMTEEVVNGFFGDRTWTFPANQAHQPTTYTQTLETEGSGSTVSGDFTTTLEWDATGRLASEAMDYPTGFDAQDQDYDYTYDEAGQLLSRTGTGDDLTYGYDPRGSRLTMEQGTISTDYQVDDDGRVLAATPSAGDATDYTYDDDGRRVLTDVGTGTETTTITYDARGLPTDMDVTGPNPISIDRQYDGDGELVGFSSPSAVSVDLLWDPTSETPQALDSYINEDLWFRQVSGTRLIGQAGIQDGDLVNSNLYAYDAHGSSITNGAPTNQAPMSFDPYGIPSDTPGGWAFMGYRGAMHVGGLIHFQHRDYDPETGSFTSPDPLDGVNGMPTVANPYHYADNDPLNRTDPTGLYSIGSCLAPVVVLSGDFVPGDELLFGLGCGAVVVLGGYLASQATQDAADTLGYPSVDTDTAVSNPGPGPSTTSTTTTIAPPPITLDQDDGGQILVHYTTAESALGILACQCIHSSSGDRNARHGDGAYFTDLRPGDVTGTTSGQLSYALYEVPFNYSRLTDYVEVDADRVQPRPAPVAPLYGSTYSGSIYLAASSGTVSLAGAIRGTGAVPY